MEPAAIFDQSELTSWSTTAERNLIQVKTSFVLQGSGMATAGPGSAASTAGRVTMLDVARRAGVSRTTASFVLTGRRREMRISTETEHRVMRAARELNYRPSLLAQGLNTRSTKTIGLIWNVVSGSTIGVEMVRGIIAEGTLHDHWLLVGESENDARLDKRLVQSMVERGVSGFLLASMETRRISVPRLLGEHPLVLLNCVASDPGMISVLPDERAAGREAVRVLAQAGHTDGIVVIGEIKAGSWVARERVTGIKAGLKSAGLAPLDSTVSWQWRPDSAYTATCADLTDNVRPAALICLDERVAMGVYQALRDCGWSVPGDIFVVSFADSGLGSFLRPALTSTVPPHFEMGRYATELLLTGESKPGLRLVKVPLRVGVSVGPPTG